MRLIKFKNIIFKIVLKPKEGWNMISSETYSVSDLILFYLSIVFISSIALFLGLLLNVGVELGVDFILLKVLVFDATYLIWYISNILLLKYVFLYFDKNSNISTVFKIVTFSSVILLITSFITNIFIDSNHLFLTFLSEIYSVYIFLKGVEVFYKFNESQKFISAVFFSILLFLIFLLVKTFQYFV